MSAIVAPARHRAGVVRRELRREVSRLHDRRRVLAIVLLGLAFGLTTAFLWARGELAGGDARAYWAAVRIWLNGGDPYHPTGPFMPYVYAPWLLPAFAPWALLPWDVAWFSWRGADILLLLWTIHWAYRRRPLPTAILFAFLAPAVVANLDTGNLNLPIVYMLWAAQFSRPATAGLLWALATALKWLPAAFLPLVAPRGRAWGAGFLAGGGLLTLITLPATLVQLQVLLAFPRPARVDYLVFLWALVPWLWRLPDPAHLARPSSWRIAAASGLASARGWLAATRRDPAGAPARTLARVRQATLAFFGIVR